MLQRQLSEIYRCSMCLSMCMRRASAALTTGSSDTRYTSESFVLNLTVICVSSAAVGAAIVTTEVAAVNPVCTILSFRFGSSTGCFRCHAMAYSHKSHETSLCTSYEYDVGMVNQ
jgi:hypothetical protein